MAAAATATPTGGADVPLYGTLDPVALGAPDLPEMPHWDTEAWALPRADILQLAWEVSPATRALLPRAMHPAVPSYVTFFVMRYLETRKVMPPIPGAAMSAIVLVLLIVAHFSDRR